ncbi:alpha/beta hydrolase family protein [Amycolatopsis sp. NPDC059027]|uniref:alpha/beta hydrolase family protein n=1 Tax=unclassified Amycolatopsis TaxID=2618356 RepID=UPI0036700DB6
MKFFRAAVAALILALVTVTAPQAAATQGVGVVEYNLGDQAFRDPTVSVPMELAAVVHYPRDLGRRPHPLIVQEHGSWWSCVDPVAKTPQGDWPCPAGQRPLPSFRGYDYLGEKLAERGFIVVSISANAINAHLLGEEGYFSRAHLVNKHLELWRDLARGEGPLAGALGRFRGHVDLTRVGTMGHSRGGKGVMWQASDKHTPEWPAGVRIRAVVPLAPVYFNYPEENNSDVLVTRVPFKVIVASCDGAVGVVGLQYVKDVEGKNSDASAVTLTGANHNFFNTEWSPGKIGGEDDAPASCVGKLTPAQQRGGAVREIVSFFTSRLQV